MITAMPHGVVLHPGMPGLAHRELAAGNGKCKGNWGLFPSAFVLYSLSMQAES